MFYVNLETADCQGQISEDTIINILIIPGQERSFRDHEILFRFFYHHEYFEDIERTKSFNARLLAITKLVVFDRRPETNEYDVVQKIKMERVQEKKIYYEPHYISIKHTDLEVIKNTDEKYLRQNMDILKQFSLCAWFKYEQLLHIAYYMKIENYKYKEYIYHEKQESTYVYFVIEGQFHYLKQVDQSTQVKNQGKKKKQKRYDESQQNPNRLKKLKKKDLVVGIIEGGHGQVFGEEEIINNESRVYSVRCMSTRNLVIKIHREYFNHILKGDPNRMIKIQSENKQKTQYKKSFLDKTLETKQNYSRYIQLIQEGQNKIKKQTISQEIKMDSINSEEECQEQANKPSRCLLQNRKLIQNLSKSRLSLQKKNTFLTSQESQQNENLNNIGEGEIFPLTHAHNQSLEVSKKLLHQDKKILPKSVHTTEISRQQPFLPEISSRKSGKNEPIQVKVAKSWSASRPNLHLRSVKNKYSGLIDANTLVQEKEYILWKKMPKNMREQIYPIEVPHKKKPALVKIQKIKAKEEVRQHRSAVHSKDYMQSLLVDALKKAGYNAEKKQESYIPENINNTFDIKVNMRIPHSKYLKQNKNKVSESLLQDNPFDKYYFRQL